jgi:MFS family permease
VHSGLPPFFALFLKKSYGTDAMVWGNFLWLGFCMSCPLFFRLWQPPFWGKLSDRFGKKRLLIRAQLGLAFQFFSGWIGSDGLPVFSGPLLAQGNFWRNFCRIQALSGYVTSQRTTRLRIEFGSKAPLERLWFWGRVWSGFFMGFASPIRIYLISCHGYRFVHRFCTLFLSKRFRSFRIVWSSTYHR